MHDIYGMEMYSRERCKDLMREAEHERLISEVEKTQADKHGSYRLRISIEMKPVRKNNRQIVWEV